MPSLFILAGEASGDRIGAALMGQLREHGKIAITGVGGENMAGQGLASLFAMNDLAVMGYADVIRRLPLLLWRARQVVKFIQANQPDIVVLIDAQVFSQVVASRLRKSGYRGRIVLYVAPAVWAWKPERAKAIAPLYDEVFGVLPFEPLSMRQLGGPPTSYVGHPALDRFTFRDRQPERGPVLLLPGSRGGELKRHLPLMREVAASIGQHRAVSHFVMPTLASLAERLEKAVATWPVDVAVVRAEQERHSAMADAVAAFAVSGTATLELALGGVPHILTYVAEPAQVRIFKAGNTDYIGLPNIIAGKQVVPEVLFVKTPEAGTAIAALNHLLDDSAARAEQIKSFAAIRQLMEKGAPEAPLQNAADRLLSLLA